MSRSFIFSALMWIMTRNISPFAIPEIVGFYFVVTSGTLALAGRQRNIRPFAIPDIVGFYFVVKSRTLMLAGGLLAHNCK